MNAETADTPDEQPECCEFCGLPITEPGQRCPAIDDGQCQTTEEVLAAHGGESA